MEPAGLMNKKIFQLSGRRCLPPFTPPVPSQQVLTRQLDQFMVHYDVLGVVEVTSQRHHVRACELVGTIDGFIFTVCPKHSILRNM